MRKKIIKCRNTVTYTDKIEAISHGMSLGSGSGADVEAVVQLLASAEATYRADKMRDSEIS
jgi:hypothetical protein